jgi:hypothetical protein
MRRSSTELFHRFSFIQFGGLQLGNVHVSCSAAMCEITTVSAVLGVYGSTCFIVQKKKREQGQSTGCSHGFVRFCCREPERTGTFLPPHMLLCDVWPTVFGFCRSRVSSSASCAGVYPNHSLSGERKYLGQVLIPKIQTKVIFP